MTCARNKGPLLWWISEERRNSVGNSGEQRHSSGQSALLACRDCRALSHCPTVSGAVESGGLGRLIADTLSETRDQRDRAVFGDVVRVGTHEAQELLLIIRTACQRR